MDGWMDGWKLKVKNLKKFLVNMRNNMHGGACCNRKIINDDVV